MPFEPATFLSGPLLEEEGFPLSLCARACDLRPRFLAKGQVGSGYRAISRNGRILLASDCPLSELPDRTVRVRLRTWHRAILPGDAPEPYGILLAIRTRKRRPDPRQDARADEPPLLTMQLVGSGTEQAALTLDVGGGRALQFSRLPHANNTT